MNIFISCDCSYICKKNIISKSTPPKEGLEVLKKEERTVSQRAEQENKY
jgi:hypothetical protein